MAKSTKKTPRSNTTEGVLLAIIVLLVLSLAGLVLAYPKPVHKQANSGVENGSVVSLGALAYDFSSGKAVKRTDPRLTSLASFLKTEGEKSVGSNCEVVYHNVVMASPDETQVLLNYGCDHPGAKMFAVWSEGEWKLISPTNQFDMLGIPLCEHVTANAIDRSIAPVCGNPEPANPAQLTYTVR